jgi:SPP1 gp7 family putative phage head morphogenesis protein
MAADGIGAPTDPSRWRDAQEWFQKRRPVIRNGATQTVRDAQARAFRVAGITSVNLVTEVHQAIDDAIANGTTLDDFKKRVGAKLADEWGAPNARRVETIFRTNVQSAYNAGRWAEMNRPAVLAVRPFWKYVAILDGRTTATCAPLNGVIAKHDDAFWESHFPPLHFNCRSTVVSLSRGETERAGGVKPVPKADKPGKGFGTRPDLAGTDFEPSENASKATKSAYADRSRREDSRGTAEPAQGPVPSSSALRDRALRVSGLEKFVGANKLSAFEVRDFGEEGDVELAPGTERRAQLDPTTNGEYFPGFARLYVNSRRPADSFGHDVSTAYSISARGTDLADAMERTAVHELAHHVREFIGGRLRERVRGAFAEAVAERREITPYASETFEEYFAECFAAYLYHHDELRERDRGGYDLIEEVLEKVW